MTFPFSPQGLVFDLDGTLLNTMPVHFAAWTRVAQKYGLSFPEERFYALAGTPTLRIVELLAKEQGLSLDAEKVALEKEQAYIEDTTPLKVIPEVFCFVEEYYGKIPLSIATGGNYNVVSGQLARSGIGRYFAAVACADEVKNPKPHPEVFLLAAKKMGVSPEKCVGFEDAELGLTAIKAAGMYPVDIRPLVETP